MIKKFLIPLFVITLSVEAKIKVKGELKVLDKTLINAEFVIDDNEHVNYNFENVKLDLHFVPKDKQIGINLLLQKKDNAEVIAREEKVVNWGDIAEFNCPHSKGNNASLKITVIQEQENSISESI